VPIEGNLDDKRPKKLYASAVNARGSQGKQSIWGGSSKQYTKHQWGGAPQDKERNDALEAGLVVLRKPLIKKTTK